VLDVWLTTTEITSFMFVEKNVLANLSRRDLLAAMPRLVLQDRRIRSVMSSVAPLGRAGRARVTAHIHGDAGQYSLAGLMAGLSRVKRVAVQTQKRDVNSQLASGQSSQDKRPISVWRICSNQRG
jgi:hypothetical protein